MSSSNGYVVFTATPEMAKQMPKVFKAGATYVAQRATAIAVGGGSVTTTKNAPRTKPSTKKKVEKKAKVAKKVAKKVTKKVAKKVAKKGDSPKIALVKETKRKPVRPDVVLSFVRSNAGCNMTDIEGAVSLPQAVIRRILNSAREAGEIRTEGKRRGLHYFAEATASSVSADNSADVSAN